MPGFDEHINQAKKNLKFLEDVNKQFNADYIDWQVTICFYTALHLVNAHLSKFDIQYRKHSDVNDALNPYNQLSISKLPLDEYESYISLQSLSRRSRYLVNEKDRQIGSFSAAITYDVHLCKAIKHLNKIIAHFSEKYSLDILPISVKCICLKASDKLRYFLVEQ